MSAIININVAQSAETGYSFIVHLNFCLSSGGNKKKVNATFNRPIKGKRNNPRSLDESVSMCSWTSKFSSVVTRQTVNNLFYIDFRRLGNLKGAVAP